ncbi:GntR family transcriptional regulator [Oenococcus sicerae]|uniref:GntR family transcriptional regulator n=1 Tax=Oenococcus sicerae TaxID=2203724 RepID=A0AAJ1RAI1_9LACO|nr:GntR family transcriptional regulator [Oenococcus sicerae]MDN6899998.1 GntR family transcriptional regulator [Oenococcus sicerae]QAS69610.1 GntR family transcriptional regulator [Oenococcus sicerae]
MAITRKKPIYLKLVDRIKNEVANDILSAHDQLPSVREMALEEKINPNTVAKAYKELEKQNVIETIPGKGTFVTRNTQNIKILNRKQLIDNLAEAIDKLQKNGIETDKIKKIIAGILGGKDAKN